MFQTGDRAFAAQADQEVLEDQTRQLVQLVARLLRHARIQADAVPAEIQALLRAEGLGPRHLSVLIALAVGGPTVVGQLAERISLAPATTSLLVSELRRGGMVERHTDKADRRRALISIRDDLRPSVAALAERRLRPLRSTLASLSEQERAHFLRGWRILIDMFEQGETPQLRSSQDTGKE